MKNSRRVLLTVGEVAWLTGSRPADVCRAIRVGLLPVVRRRGRVFVPLSAVAHLADSGNGGAGR